MREGKRRERRGKGSDGTESEGKRRGGEGKEGAGAPT